MLSVIYVWEPVSRLEHNFYRNSVVSFCNTALLLISDFFSTPLAKQKKARYNMTRRTEMVIWMVNELGFYRL